ncbi:MAG: hotdog domain-containing protein [Casimicrobiaceae bacterium]
MIGEPQIGAHAEATTRVTHADLASAVGIAADDVFPAVYATSRLVALMEIAAARVLAAYLDPAERSVGVSVDIAHDAATPVGAEVTATAVFTGRQGKRFVFDVAAHDGGGQVGHGTHQRAVVDAGRLESGAARRAAYA